MPGDTDIASFASLLADPTRISILTAFNDGRAFPANELARRANVAPSTASTHLTKLVENGLISVEKQGRHRYFRLSNPAIMLIIEELAAFAPAKVVRTLHEAEAGDAVRRARTCYNHVAGKLGVELTQAFLEKHFLIVIEDGYKLSQEGKHWFHDFGIAEKLLKKELFVPRHIDWSERRYHFAGALGAAFTKRLFEVAWIKRIPGGRAVSVTETGCQELLQTFALHW